MPDFTKPIHEHGSPGDKDYPHGKGRRAPTNTGEETTLALAAREYAAEIRAGGAKAEQAHKELALYPADSTMHGYVMDELAKLPKPPAPRKPLGQRHKDRAAGMRRQRLADGGEAARKQRALDFRMAQGRQTQKTIRAIRKREGIK